MNSSNDQKQQTIILRSKKKHSKEKKHLDQCTNLTEHQIILKNGKIINLRSHKLPEKHRQFALEETKKLLKKEIIRENQSPYNSPLWIVPKKGNKLRMVIDYRKINDDTDQDTYPLPMIDKF